MKGELLRIVPPEASGGGMLPAQGTEVWVGDQRLSGVTKVELVAEVNDVWRAKVHCLAIAQHMEALGNVSKASLWSRVRYALTGK